MRFNEAIGQVNHSVKSTGSFVFLFSLKLISGLLLGLVFGIILQEFFSYGTIALTFVILVVLFLFLRLSNKWNLVMLLLFNSACILLGMLLKMYIVFAPAL